MDSADTRSPALLLRVQAFLPKMSKAEQRVARFVLANPNDVISLSVAGLAESSGVSDATVIRACKTLGFKSYQEFKVTLAMDIVTPIQSIHEEIHPGDDTATIFDKVFQGNMYALEYTRSTISIESMERAADAIVRARRILIFGLGNSNSVALDLQHKLMRLGIDAAAHTDSHLQAIAAVSTAPGDVVFAISHSGSSIDIVDAARISKEHGAAVISLTNIGSSPLSNTADISLFTASKETKYRIVALSSRIAQMAIIDSLYTLIACRHPQVTDNFRHIERALDMKKY